MVYRALVWLLVWIGCESQVPLLGQEVAGPSHSKPETSLVGEWQATEVWVEGTVKESVASWPHFVMLDSMGNWEWRDAPRFDPRAIANGVTLTDGTLLEVEGRRETLWKFALSDGRLLMMKIASREYAGEADQLYVQMDVQFAREVDDWNRAANGNPLLGKITTLDQVAASTASIALPAAPSDMPTSVDFELPEWETVRHPEVVVFRRVGSFEEVGRLAGQWDVIGRIASDSESFEFKSISITPHRKWRIANFLMGWGAVSGELDEFVYRSSSGHMAMIGRMTVRGDYLDLLLIKAECNPRVPVPRSMNGDPRSISKSDRELLDRFEVRFSPEQQSGDSLNDFFGPMDFGGEFREIGLFRLQKSKPTSDGVLAIGLPIPSDDRSSRTIVRWHETVRWRFGREIRLSESSWEGVSVSSTGEWWEGVKGEGPTGTYESVIYPGECLMVFARKADNRLRTFDCRIFKYRLNDDLSLDLFLVAGVTGQGMEGKVPKFSISERELQLFRAVQVPRSADETEPSRILKFVPEELLVPLPELGYFNRLQALIDVHSVRTRFELHRHFESWHARTKIEQ